DEPHLDPRALVAAGDRRADLGGNLGAYDAAHAPLEQKGQHRATHVAQALQRHDLTVEATLAAVLERSLHGAHYATCGGGRRVARAAHARRHADHEARRAEDVEHVFRRRAYVFCRHVGAPERSDEGAVVLEDLAAKRRVFVERPRRARDHAFTAAPP